jgi:hypothetical protein
MPSDWIVRDGSSVTTSANSCVETLTADPDRGQFLYLFRRSAVLTTTGRRRKYRRCHKSASHRQNSAGLRRRRSNAARRIAERAVYIAERIHGSKFAENLLVTFGDRFGEVEKAPRVVCAAGCVTEPGELVRVYISLDNDVGKTRFSGGGPPTIP